MAAEEKEELVLEGYYPMMSGDEIDPNTMFISKRYRKSVKCFDINNLFITRERRMSSFLGPVVRAIMDLSDNSLVPFYIEETEVKTLNSYLKQY